MECVPTCSLSDKIRDLASPVRVGGLAYGSIESKGKDVEDSKGKDSIQVPYNLVILKLF